MQSQSEIAVLVLFLEIPNLCCERVYPNQTMFHLHQTKYFSCLNLAKQQHETEKKCETLSQISVKIE